jgi:hypothetical protein
MMDSCARSLSVYYSTVQHRGMSTHPDTGRRGGRSLQQVREEMKLLHDAEVVGVRGIYLRDTLERVELEFVVRGLEEVVVKQLEGVEVLNLARGRHQHGTVATTQVPSERGNNEQLRTRQLAAQDTRAHEHKVRHLIEELFLRGGGKER